jgi:hypothetical protein
MFFLFFLLCFSPPQFVNVTHRRAEWPGARVGLIRVFKKNPHPGSPRSAPAIVTAAGTSGGAT